MMPDRHDDNSKGKILIPIARASISSQLGLQYSADEEADWLQEQAACFVTLTQQNQLRGCIGTLEAHRTLLEDVKSNAIAAAFHDPRFSPLTENELDITEIEISLLSPMEKMNFSSEREALDQLRPGVDGVVFEYGSYRSTFLPQVWEQLPVTRDFISHLKMKAGLSAGFWNDGVRLSRYHVSKWKERDYRSQTQRHAV